MKEHVGKTAVFRPSDRIGLEYLVRAGYDPREAPAVWKQMAKEYGNRPTNVFWSSHANNTTRRSYLMAEIRNNYEYLDYSNFKDNKEEFQRIAELVKQATAEKKKSKRTQTENSRAFAARRLPIAPYQDKISSIPLFLVTAGLSPVAPLPGAPGGNCREKLKAEWRNL